MPTSDSGMKFTGLSAQEDWGGPMRGGDTDATFLTDDPERDLDPDEDIESPRKKRCLSPRDPFQLDDDDPAVQQALLNSADPE